MAKLHFVAEPGMPHVVMTRTFNAPRELVFRAFTEPALVARWWGSKDMITVVDRLEARPGGIWRYVDRNGDGSEHAFHGVYHDVTAPERLVYTFEYEGMPGHVLLETITLEERDGQTVVTDSAVFQSVEARDGMLPGMEEGANESLDSLEDLLKTL